MIERTWTISDIDGKNPRTITLANFLAEHRAAVAAVKPVVDALYRGDHDACASAQSALRKTRR